MSDKEDKILNYVNLLCKKEINVTVRNSFERYCMYKAVEKYVDEYDTEVWLEKIRGKREIISEEIMCRKHKCGLTGGCNCCSDRDPWCCGPFCKMCGYSFSCHYAVDIGDVLYVVKDVIAFNIFYK